MTTQPKGKAQQHPGPLPSTDLTCRLKVQPVSSSSQLSFAQSLPASEAFLGGRLPVLNPGQILLANLLNSMCISKSSWWYDFLVAWASSLLTVCPAGHNLNVLTDSLPIFFSFLVQGIQGNIIVCLQRKKWMPNKGKRPILISKRWQNWNEEYDLLHHCFGCTRLIHKRLLTKYSFQVGSKRKMRVYSPLSRFEGTSLNWWFRC